MSGARALLRDLLRELSKRRIAIGALTGATGLLAVVSLFLIPVQLLPEIRYPQIRIISDLPGQSSRVVEESVNEPIEAALAGTPGIVRTESRSGDGRSYIDLFFAPGHDLDRALRDVTEAVQRAQTQIPTSFPSPRIFTVSTVEEPAIQIAVGSSTLSAADIRQRVRANLLPRIRAVPGVEAVFLGREEIPELVIDIDPVAQVAAGVNLTEIENVLMQATAPPPSSPLRTSGFEGIVVLGEGSWNPQSLLARPVPIQGTDQSVPLASLAYARRAPSEETLKTRLDGQPAVLVSVHRSTSAHALRMARDVRNILDDIRELPAFADVEATMLFDDSVVTRSAVLSVVTAAVGGALLAILLLFFTLRHRRYTPLVAVVVGVSLAATIIVLTAMGQTLNLLTLAGLLLSVGLGLDYAIIYFDRLDRLPPDAEEPHLQAMVDVAGPLLGALLTTVAAVIPFFLVQGLVALLFRPLVWTVVISAVFCFIFAVVLLPVFARRDHTHEPTGNTTSTPSEHPWWKRSRTPPIAWGLAAGLALLLVLGGRALPFEVLPVVDDGFVEARLTHPAGIPLEEMNQIAGRAESALLELPGSAAVFSTVGGYFRDGLPAFRPGTADFMIRVDTEGGDLPSQEWAARARTALSELEIPGLRVSVTPPRIRGVQTRLAAADLIVVLTREDGDLLALAELEAPVTDVLRSVPGLIEVQRIRGGVSPRWRGTPDYQRLASAGVSPEGFQRTLTYALEGQVLRERMENGEPLALRARYDRRVAGGPHQLEMMRVLTRSGGDAHLGDLADFDLVEEPTHIERREGQRVVRVGAQLDPAGPGPAAVGRAVNQALAGADLPPGVGWWLEGELDALEETRRTFTISLALALVLVLTLLAVQYGSIPFAIAGLVSIPLSGAGAILLLWILGRPLDAMVLAGLLIAVGIVANNVILVLSQAQGHRRDHEGTTMSEALGRAADDRLRPITLTAFSTVLGMSPLLFGGAEVFGLLQPLAIALTGTLLMSIPLACFVLPGMASSLAALRDDRAGDA